MKHYKDLRLTFVTGALAVAFPGSGPFALPVAGTNLAVGAELEKKNSSIVK